MAQFSADSFTGTDGATLQAYNANWTRHPSYSVDQRIYSNRLRTVSGTQSAYYHSGAPASADYSVSVDIYVQSYTPSSVAYGVLGRASTSANTFYHTRHMVGSGWELYKFSSGSATQLGSTVPQTLTAGTSYQLKLEMVGSAIKAYVDGALTISGTDSAITATGKAGVRGHHSGDSPTTGLQLDNFSADDISSGASGTVAATNADDTSSANATLTVTASSATTNADDISNASVGSEVSGTVAVTNADDISAATASPVVSASSDTTNADDISNAAASPVVSASAASTNANDISDASAAVGSEVVGSVAYTNIDDASSATLKATITASVAVTNADDVSVADASPVASLSSATTNADDISDAVAVAETGEIIASVNVTNANDISNAVAAPVLAATVAYSNLHDLSAAIAEINFGTIVEALLTTGLVQDSRIKKPGIPSDAPEWQRTMFEIFTGRRGNKITVAPHQTLTFSATPTQAECEALYSYVSDVRQSIDQLTKRFDS